MNAERIIVVDYARCAKALLRNIGLILIVTVLCVVVGAAGAYLFMDHADIYEARASVISNAGDVYEETLDVVQYADIVKSLKVADRAAEILDDSRVDRYRIYNMIEVEYDDSPYTTVSSAVINILAQSTDADEAVRVVNAVAQAFVVEAFNITDTDRFEILDQASESERIYVAQKQMMTVTVAAGIIGLLMVCAIIAIREMLSLRLQTVKDGTLYGELDIMGVIPVYDKNVERYSPPR